MWGAIIDSETARLAMEKGFIFKSDSPDENSLVRLMNTSTAPSQVVLRRWLKDTHGIHIEIVWYETGYSVYIRIIEMSKRITIDVFINYEGALEIGLQEALKIIKNQNQSTMKEKLIDYKTAKLADAKGFTNEVMYAINKNNEYFEKNRNYYNWNDAKYPNLLSAPTHAMLYKWLREEHKIYIDTQTEIVRGKVIFKIIVLHTPILSDTTELDDNFEDYDVAFEAGLQHALGLITD